MGNQFSREKRKNNKKTGGSSSKKLKGSTKFPFVKKGKSSRTGQEQSTQQVQQSQRESLKLPIQRPETQQVQQSQRESLKLPIQRPETQQVQQSQRESLKLPIQRPETQQVQQSQRESLKLPIQRPETQQVQQSQRESLKLPIQRPETQQVQQSQRESLKLQIQRPETQQEPLKSRFSAYSSNNSKAQTNRENQQPPLSISKYLSNTEVDPGMENYQRTRLAALEQQEQEEESHRARVNNANKEDIHFLLAKLQQTGAGIRPEGNTKNPKEAYDRLNQREEQNILRERLTNLDLQHLEQGVAEQLIIPDPQGPSESKFSPETQQVQQSQRESLKLPIQRPETQQVQQSQRESLKLQIQRPETQQEPLKSRFSAYSSNNSKAQTNRENQQPPLSISKYLSNTEVDPGMENYQRTRLAALEQQEQEEESHRARVNNANKEDIHFLLAKLQQTGAGIRPEGNTKNPKEAYDRLNQREEQNILRERLTNLDLQHLEQGVAEQLIIPDPQGPSESKFSSDTESDPDMENIILRERQAALEIHQLEEELKEDLPALARQREEDIGGSSIENKKEPPLTSKWSSSNNSDESKSVEVAMEDSKETIKVALDTNKRGAENKKKPPLTSKWSSSDNSNENKSVRASEWYERIAQLEEQNQVQQEPVTSRFSAYSSNADSEEERFQKMLYGSD